MPGTWVALVSARAPTESNWCTWIETTQFTKMIVYKGVGGMKVTKGRVQLLELVTVGSPY